MGLVLRAEDFVAMENVVGLKPWSFSCGSLNSNILLVINTILQNVKLMLFTSFGTLDISFGFFEIFAKKWEI